MDVRFTVRYHPVNKLLGFDKIKMVQLGRNNSN